MVGVSVLICCFNSEKRIIDTLKHLMRQNIEGLTVEIILVDNNSKDNTGRVATKFWESSGSIINFKVVRESKPGLSEARKTGVRKAKGEVIIFCDDDNWLDCDYILNAWNLIQANERIGVLGGIGFPVFEGEKPTWFDKYQKYYALGAQGESSGDITESKGYVYGAGSVFKRGILQEVFRNKAEIVLSDRNGSKIISGGDNELCYLITFLGYRIYFNDELKFRHFIPESRLTLKYLKKFRSGQAESYDIICSYESLLCSNGSRRRNNNLRLKEYKKFMKRITELYILRLRKRIDAPDFVFQYYNLRKILALGFIRWNLNSKKEAQVFKNYITLSKT